MFFYAMAQAYAHVRRWFMRAWVVLETIAQKMGEGVGILVDAVKGPNYTYIYEGKDKEHTEQVDLSSVGYVDVKVVSKQIIYRTRYKRWWIPDSIDTLYEVCGSVPAEMMLELEGKVSPLFFQPAIYPLLCSRLLRWTSYPHTYAINAYLDRLLVKPHRHKG